MSYVPPRLPLVLLRDRLAVCRLEHDAPSPEWAREARPVAAVVRTPSELSVLVGEGAVPAGVRAERGYRAVMVRGPLPFDLVGIFAAIVQPLAEGGLSIFALSTFDTDYVLVKERDLDAALALLEGCGHAIEREA